MFARMVAFGTLIATTHSRRPERECRIRRSKAEQPGLRRRLEQFRPVSSSFPLFVFVDFN